MPLHDVSAVDAIAQIAQVKLTSGDLTTSSTTFVDATGLTVTLSTAARRCLVLFNASGHNNTNTANIAIDLAIDGTRQGQGYGLVVIQASASAAPNINMGFSYLTDVLSVGSHTFKIQWRVDAGTGTLFASTGVTPAILQVIELA